MFLKAESAIRCVSDRDFPIKNRALLPVGGVTTLHAEPTTPGRLARRNTDLFFRPRRFAQSTTQSHFRCLSTTFFPKRFQVDHRARSSDHRKRKQVRPGKLDITAYDVRGLVLGPRYPRS